VSRPAAWASGTRNRRNNDREAVLRRIKGTTAAGSDIDVSFDTLLDNLNTTFCGGVR
jgi:hypothetical protein